MKERPIIFAGESVRAILDDKKHQSRRLLRRDYGCRCQYGTDGDALWVKETFASTADEIVYRATDGRSLCDLKWKSPLFMPRAASRITLAVTSVRIERLQDISERDACDEVGGNPMLRWCYRPKFAKLWDSLNAKRATWETNPWVWVLSFRMVKP